MPMPNFPRGDMKYYWRLHVKKMRAQGKLPVSYSAFSCRLNKMNLHDAIETPRAEYQVRDLKSKTPVQDSIRRIQTLKQENVQVLDLDELVRLEHQRPRKANRIQMPKPKQTLWHRFISLFR